MSSPPVSAAPSPAETSEEIHHRPGRVGVAVVPSLPASVVHLRRLVRQEARRWLLPEDVRETLQLVVSELAGNVVLHSASPYIALLLRAEAGVLIVKVRDGGRWGEGSPSTAREDDDCCGRGLLLVGAMVARLRVVRTGAGSEVVAEIDLPTAAGPGRRTAEQRPAIQVGSSRELP
ncbi:ATP-binding protein [Streptomyces sp. NPDC012693]|jgi:anti-sigma regulatory factor (Ser/Thr protein kinase)|uniref:ATP-binding protein n=1 Tax=unclassified Streptomyces TaxID=2593676 RepID=UPI002030D4A7|nr:ATP-binding protein [Streptomyces sp. MSC1_001]